MPKPSEIYEKLYHYTTVDGLLGIRQTRSLWATHYKFLNDYSEIVLFRDKLISLLLPYVREKYEKLIKVSPYNEQRFIQKGGLEQAIKHDTELLVANMYRALGDEIYILSFCGQHKDPRVNSNGLLSQWRGYGTGGGFALVFNTQKLEEMLAIEGEKFQYSAGHFLDLVYSDDENKLKEECSEDLSIIADAVKLFFDNQNLSEQEIIENQGKAFSPFIKCISRYKHYSFFEENEVRVVIVPTVLDSEYLKQARSEGVILKPEKERKFRNKNGQHVPYIELFNTVGIELPIEQIIIGPHKEMEARASALREMLRNTKIKITRSDIPFVGYSGFMTRNTELLTNKD